MTYYKPQTPQNNITLNTSATGLNAYTIGISNTTATSAVLTGAGSNGSWNQAMTVGQTGRLSLKGEDPDIDINGKSMKQWMERVEARLAMLEPNTKLEAEWQELKDLGDQYRALEKEIQEKMKTWDILRKE